MRIAIVNDMAMAVEVLRRLVQHETPHEIAWVAKDGEEAARRAAADTPDLILMDLVMPVMNGAESTRRIMAKSPCAILIVTASVGANYNLVFEAMGHGALDVVKTPILGTSGKIDGGHPFLHKLDVMHRLIGEGTGVRQTEIGLTTVIPHLKSSAPRLIAVGASTGGPKALAGLLGKLPGDFPACIIIVQHLDADFSEGFVSWLSEQTPLRVKQANIGDRPEISTVFVAGTNDHLILSADLAFTYSANPKDCPYRPSVDVFFNALAESWPRKETAILLTGMGRDGAEGLLHLRKRGWHTLAQDQSSSVVYGMPKAAKELDAAEQILTIGEIPTALARLFNVTL